MPGSRNFPLGLKSTGFQRIVTNSTATTLNTTCVTASTIWMTVETQNVRITMDGSTTPTANTGILLTTDTYALEGIDASKLKIARAAAGAIVNIQAFKRIGEG